MGDLRPGPRGRPSRPCSGSLPGAPSGQPVQPHRLGLNLPSRASHRRCPRAGPRPVASSSYVHSPLPWLPAGPAQQRRYRPAQDVLPRWSTSASTAEAFVTPTTGSAKIERGLARSAPRREALQERFAFSPRSILHGHPTLDGTALVGLEALRNRRLQPTPMPRLCSSMHPGSGRRRDRPASPAGLFSGQRTMERPLYVSALQEIVPRPHAGPHHGQVPLAKGAELVERGCRYRRTTGPGSPAQTSRRSGRHATLGTTIAAVRTNIGRS